MVGNKEAARIIRLVFRELDKHHGPQGWWPLLNKRTLASEYKGVLPATEEDCFEIVVGAILVQNTQWQPNVTKALQQLYRYDSRVFTPQAITALPTQKLQSLIRSSGYFRQKAEKLKAFANHVLRYHQGSVRRMFSQSLTVLRDELLSIPGIGPETADSILLYAANKPSFVIDAYAKRLFSRMGLCREDVAYEQLQQQCVAALSSGISPEALTADASLYRQHHALIVAHAKQSCRKVPLCSSCLLQKHCSYPKGGSGE